MVCSEEAAWPSGQRFGLAIRRSRVSPGLVPSPALATCWICSWSSRVQIFDQACKLPTGCLLPVEVFTRVMLYLSHLFLNI